MSKKDIGDIFTDLESAIIAVRGVALTMMALGDRSPEGEIFGYLGRRLEEHHSEVRAAFDKLFDHKLIRAVRAADRTETGAGQ